MRRRALRHAARTAIDAERSASRLNAEAEDAERRASELDARVAEAAARVHELETARDRVAARAHELAEEVQERVAEAEERFGEVQTSSDAQLQNAHRSEQEARHRAKLAGEAERQCELEYDEARAVLATARDLHAAAEEEADLAHAAAEAALDRGKRELNDARAHAAQQVANADRIIASAGDDVRAAHLAQSNAAADEEALRREHLLATETADERRRLADLALGDALRAREVVEAVGAQMGASRKPRPLIRRVLTVIAVIALLGGGTAVALTALRHDGSRADPRGMATPATAQTGPRLTMTLVTTKQAPQARISISSTARVEASYRLELATGASGPTAIDSPLTLPAGSTTALTVPLGGSPTAGTRVTARLYPAGSGVVLRSATAVLSAP